MPRIFAGRAKQKTHQDAPHISDETPNDQSSIKHVHVAILGASGCASWYLDASGKNTTLWPGFTFEFRRRTRHFDARNYILL